VDQDYQEAWILPMQALGLGERYAVVQPHHKKAWAGFGRDIIDAHRPFKILGIVDSLEQAQAICREITAQPGMLKDTRRLLRSYPALHKLPDNLKAYQSAIAQQTRENLTTPWRLVEHQKAQAYSAYRVIMTAQGQRIEFAPPPPSTLRNRHATFRYLQKHKLLQAETDTVLPKALPDGGRLADTPVLAMAWHVQSAQKTARIPWTVVPLDDPAQGHPQWVAACQTVNAQGQPVWRFFPPWPRTLSRAAAVQDAIAPLLAPTDSFSVPVASDPALITTVDRAWQAVKTQPTTSATLRAPARTLRRR